MAGLLFILSAPSGSGKSTLVSQLRSLVSGLEFSVSWTTRPLRGSEQDGREYHFTTRETFERMVANDEFLEHADVFGNHYGTARRSLIEAAAHGRDLLLDIDVQGAAQVRQKLPDAISIFILPPDPETLERRLRNRSMAEGGVPDEIVQKRLDTARQEIAFCRQYKYVLINDVLDRAVEELTAIVYTERAAHGHPPQQLSPESLARYQAMAEACRTENSQARLERVLASFAVPM